MTRWLALGCALAALPAAAQTQPAPDAPQSLTVDEPVYVVVGKRGGSSARSQLSFKVRLFERAPGRIREQPWLSGIHLGYTQTSLWNLSDDSRPYHDTIFRPSLFWAWARTGDNAWADALRAGYEHESNGRSGASSRAIDTLFVRPEWRWDRANGRRLEFTPKLYAYLNKDGNTGIQRYRGYVDWRLRHGDRRRSWVAMARSGTGSKGSLTLDWFERARVLDFGPVPAYFHAQFFAGYGESLLEYDVRRKSQLRLGVAIVP